MRTTRVLLAAAHLDHDPANNRLRNLKSLCQRCHMLHDRQHHLEQRWVTYRRRYAVGDLFLGLYRPYRDQNGQIFDGLGYRGKASPSPGSGPIWPLLSGRGRWRGLHPDTVTLWDCAPAGQHRDA